MDNQPVFSIIVLNWNGDKWLSSCFRSIQLQTYLSYEVILADNNSIDRSIYTALSHSLPIQIAAFSKNIGYTGANNLASHIARGTWLIFLNNDTQLAPDFLEQLARVATNKQSAHIMVPTIKDYEGSTPGEYHFALDILGYPSQRVARDPFWGHGCALTVRRDVFVSLGGFDDDYFIFFEESDFCWRAQITGHDIVGAPDAVVQHFGGGTVGDGTIVAGRIVTSAQRRYLSERNRLSNLLKNYGAFMLCIVIPLYFFMIFFAVILLSFSRQWPLVRAYVQAIEWHIKNIRRTLRKRAQVQRLRIRNDLFFLSSMYLGLREFELLLQFGIPSAR